MIDNVIFTVFVSTFYLQHCLGCLEDSDSHYGTDINFEVIGYNGAALDDIWPIPANCEPTSDLNSKNVEWGVWNTNLKSNCGESNVRSNRATKTINSIMKMSSDDESDFFIIVLNNRIDPQDGNPGSSQLLIARSLNIRLRGDLENIKQKRCKNKNKVNLQNSNPKSILRDNGRLRHVNKVKTAGNLKREASITEDMIQRPSSLVSEKLGKNYKKNKINLKRSPIDSSECVPHKLKSRDGITDNDSVTIKPFSSSNYVTLIPNNDIRNINEDNKSNNIVDDLHYIPGRPTDIGKTAPPTPARLKGIQETKNNLH